MKIELVLWDYEDGGNVEHVAEHGLSIEEVEFVLSNFHIETTSRSTGLPMVMGYLDDGRLIAVAFNWIDRATIYVETAYELETDR